MILRQRDANSGWTCSAPRREGAADGTLEERRYYCQNWRADLGAMVTSGGVMVEWAKFTSYGIPIGLPGGDTDSNGSCDGSDESAIHVWAAGYDARADFDLDGDIDGDDETLANSNTASTGWNALSTAANANRVGYAGYQHDYNLDLKHVRNRVYSTELGRWTRRDPLGYVDGMGLYEYVGAIPITDRDSSGLAVALQPNTLADPCQPNWSHITTYIECRDFCNMRRLRGDRSCNKQYDADKANCDIQFPDDEAARRLCKKNALIKRERCKREAIECQNRCLLKCMSHFIPNIADIAGGGGNIGYE